jgi:hypothetical protein
MHRTNAGEKRKTLREEAPELEREAQILQKVEEMCPAAQIRQAEAARLREEAEALKPQARLGQTAGLEAQIQSLGIRKNEIEDSARELEACLERPTLEQQAAAIAGPRLVW